MTFHRHAIARAAFAAMIAAAAPAWAQSTGDAANGKLLFEDTPGASGNNTLTSSCNNCHNLVGFTVIEGRRLKIAGVTGAIPGTTSPAPAITFSTAMARLSYGLQNINPMRQFETGLTGQQIRDIGAYLADTPKVDVTDLAFSAAAVNTMVTHNLTITAPVTATTALKVVSIGIAGNNAARFSRTFSCDGASLTAGQSCTVGVTFSSPSATTVAQTNPVLKVTMNQGVSTVPIVRNVMLTGETTGATTPAPTTPAPTTPATTESGGGALGWDWLAGLTALSLALAATRRRQRGNGLRDRG